MKTYKLFMETLPHSGVVTPKQTLSDPVGGIQNRRNQFRNFKSIYPNFPNIFLDKRGMVKKGTGGQDTQEPGGLIKKA